MKAKVAFSTGDRNWTEHVNIVDVAAAVFKKLGYVVLQTIPTGFGPTGAAGGGGGAAPGG